MQVKMQELISKICTALHNYINNRVKLFLITVALCMSGVAILLISEYRFFKIQREKMLELKEDYRNYVLAVKKILNDYHTTKERLDELESMLEEKKNANEDADFTIAQSAFPDGVRVYSSDDEDDEESPSFMVINREL